MTEIKRDGKIAIKLAVSVFIPLVIIIACCFVYTTYTMRESVLDLKDNILIEESMAISNTVDTYFANYHGIVKTMMLDHELIEIIDDIQNNNILSDLDVRSLEDYSGAMLKLENIAASDTETIDLAYVIDTDKCYLLYNGGGTEYFPVVYERNYYIDAKAEGDIVMCDPYLSSVGNELVVPMSAPIYNESGRMIGVAALDFKLSALDNILSQYDSTEGDFFIVVSENGHVIHNSYLGDFNPENIYDSGVDNSLIDLLNGRTSGRVEFTMPDGELVHCTTSEVGDWGWQVIAGMNNSLYMQEVTKQGVQLLIIFIAILVLVLALTLLICHIFIVKPIGKLVEVANEMASGNLNIVFEVSENNEIGILGDALSSSINQIKNYSGYIDEIAYVLDQVSNGNLGFELRNEFTGEFSKVKTALERTAYMLNDSLSAIQTAAEQVDAGSDQVAAGAQGLSQGATEQASSIQELAAMVNDINNNVAQAGEYALQANDKASEAGELAIECNVGMQELVEAMGDISNSSQEISKIIKTIEDIAFQTNILALNAAVEAARAGQAGRGFAVVADEVRSLAAKSAEASKNTSALIESSILAVSKGVSLVSKSAETLEQVAEHAHEVSGMVGQIASTAQGQMDAMQQISIGLDQISGVVQTNSATAEQSAAASEELSSQAAVMKGLVGRFKLLGE